MPLTHDLVEGGISYAIRSLPYIFLRRGAAGYDQLRRVTAKICVELAFRRYLSELNMPFNVNATRNFSDYDCFDVLLAGHRIKLQTRLISNVNQIEQIRQNPDSYLNAHAMVPSDQHSSEGQAGSDMYVFAFVPARVTRSILELGKGLDGIHSGYLLHAMPRMWRMPPTWSPMKSLVLKTEQTALLNLEIHGQNEARELITRQIRLNSGQRTLMNGEYYSITSFHTDRLPEARIGIHCPIRKETHIIPHADWGDLWLHGSDIFLCGTLSHEEFGHHAELVQLRTQNLLDGSTKIKYLAVPISELKPVSRLFEQSGERSPIKFNL